MAFFIFSFIRSLFISYNFNYEKSYVKIGDLLFLRENVVYDNILPYIIYNDI